MKRKLFSLVIATVIICLSGALSCTAFAADAPELRAAYKIDGTVSVNFEKDSTDYVLAAFYDTDGRMLRCVTAADGVTITPPKGAAHFKAFLLNRESIPRLPAVEFPIPANHCTVYTEEELQQVMSSESFFGAIVGSDLALAQTTIPAGKTLTVPEGTTLTVSEELNVLGTLCNMGTIRNFGFIDILGGELINGGAVEGNWIEEGEYFSSGLGIEGGAYVENSGEIRDGVSVADYYREDGDALCEIIGELEITDGYIAVAFGTESIRSCLASDKDYDFILACGTDPENLNTVELGGITVPEGKILLLKDSVFDGEHSYQNSYQISEETVLTLEGGSQLLCMANVELRNFGTLNVFGALVNRGAIRNFGFIDVLGGTLSNFGVIEGSWNEEGRYDSSLGIENGAVVENNGEIHDAVSVADYYRAGGDNSLCEIIGELEITDGYIAVAFGAEQIQSCLDPELSYDIVMPCGTDPENLNTVELGGITVPEGKILLLKDSIFDGEHTYQNSYQISEGTTLALSENAVLICVGNGSIVINGSIDDQGGYVQFGDFEVIEIIE